MQAHEFFCSLQAVGAGLGVGALWRRAQAGKRHKGQPGWHVRCHVRLPAMA